MRTVAAIGHCFFGVSPSPAGFHFAREWDCNCGSDCAYAYGKFVRSCSYGYDCVMMTQ
jgi:hypothetical protein